jgi:hypothetical protein
MKPPAANPKSKDILRALMAPSRPDTGAWSSNELREILEHQMAAPLVAEQERFAMLAGCATNRVADLISSSSCRTFGDLLRNKTPPIAALRLVKDFAKAAMADEDDLPRDVARVLYILTILRGQKVSGGQLTGLDDSIIVREARRCLAFGWLPEHVRSLVREGLKNVGRNKD